MWNPFKNLRVPVTPPLSFKDPFFPMQIHPAVLRFATKMTSTPTQVGVFMDQSLEEVKDIAKEVQVDIIQLHGAEDAKFLEELQKLLPVTLEEDQLVGSQKTTTCFCVFLSDLKVLGVYLFGSLGCR